MDYLDCFWEHEMFLDMETEWSISVLSIPDFSRLRSERWLFVWRYFLFVCGFSKLFFFPKTKPKFPYFCPNPCLSLQSECRVIHSASFISPSLTKRSVPVFFPCMSGFLNHWLLLIEQKFNIFFFPLPLPFFLCPLTPPQYSYTLKSYTK